MIRLRALLPSDLDGLRAHPKQARYQNLIDAKAIPPGSLAVERNGRIVALGGLLSAGDDVAAWLLFTSHCTAADTVGIFRTCADALEKSLKDVRVVIDVDDAYPEAVRFAAMLGFAPRRSHDHEGRRLTRMVHA